MSIGSGVGETIRQLVIANETSSYPWHFRVFVQKSFSPQDVPSGLSNSIFTRLRGKYLLPIIQAWQVSKRRHADYIVATDFRMFIIALFAWALRLRSPSKVTFWLHGIPLVIEGRVRLWIFRIASIASPLVFVSEAVRNAHEYPLHRGNRKVVLNGVQDHGFRARSIGAQKPFVLQYTAAFVGWKNHRTLLHAVAKVINAGETIHLRLLGEGQIKSEMERLADELGIAPFVHFMGRRRDARELLQECDLYVHPSIGEALGIAVVEAMFAGMPIITANSGAFPEYLDHDSTALLVNCEDGGQALSDALLEMLQRIEDGRAIEMGKSAFLEANKRFGTSRYIEEWKAAVDLGNR